MKRSLLHLVVALGITALVIGCAGERNPVETSTSQVAEMSNLQGIDPSIRNLLPLDLALLEIPVVQTVVQYQSALKLVLPDRAADLEATYRYVALDGKTVEMSAKLHINRGAVRLPVPISMTFDRVTGSVVFLPEGLRFVTPAQLDVEVKNITPFSETGLEFVYINPRGPYETQTYGSMTASGATGSIRMLDAQINHFSAYAFGRRTAE